MRTFVPWAIAAAIATSALVGWRLLRPDRSKYEEPGYTVEQSHPGFEVRSYAPTLQAQVTLPGTRQQATREGFQVLAGYIFGGNTARQSIAMTTPVSAAPASQTIDMTTPVSAVQAEDGYTVAFTMPSRWTLDTLPVPNDGRIQLIEAPGHRAAVSTFAGRASTATAEAQEASLRDAMKAVGLPHDGVATLAQFDPPWVIGPWRRNEVQVLLPAR